MGREVITPQIYADDKTLIDVRLEQYPLFDIYWYHWPKDGIFIKTEDFEPVIITYHNENGLCSVIVRKAWNFNTSVQGEIPLPLRVFFSGSFHHPVVITFKKSHEGLDAINQLNYQPISVAREQIPGGFRTGYLHPSNYRMVRQKDPVDYAIEQIEYLCG